MTGKSSKRHAESGREVLGKRALNRALLERQMLLRRSTMPVAAMLEHLVGLQAQVPLQPYFGLWSRLAGFQPEELSSMIRERQAVRSPLMRTTIHLVSAQDALTLYPLARSVLQKTLRSTPFGKGTVGVDVDELLEVGREFIEEQPLTMAQLGPLLHPHWPDRDPKNLAYAVHYLLPCCRSYRFRRAASGASAVRRPGRRSRTSLANRSTPRPRLTIW
jgi:hypothetical protein